MKTGKELTRYWFEQVWNLANEEQIFELMHPDCKLLGLDLPSKGPQGFLQFYRIFQTGFDSIHIELLEMVEENNLVMANARFTALHKKSSAKVDMIFSSSVRWHKGQIIEARNIVDFTTLLAQIGSIDASLVLTSIS